jgi:heme/copper-type cytochrome/quinol oxidase subunit 2
MLSPSLTGALFWLCVAVCLVAQVALIVSAIRAPMSGSTESASMRMPSRASEVAWTVVPAIALAVLLVFTWRETRRATVVDPHAGHQQVIE